MDEIKFRVVTEFFEGEPDQLQLGVECLINGNLISDWDDMPVDILEIKDSAIKSGRYCVWTCTCGIPDCAGVDPVGIAINHEKNTIVWTNLDFPLKDYQELIFDRCQYVDCINRLWQ